MGNLNRVAGSFRDPSGYVVESDNRIFRVVAPSRIQEFNACRGVLERLVTQNRLLSFKDAERIRLEFEGGTDGLVLEHPRISFWTMPYEWSFAMLREAALFHLQLHLDLLEDGYTLADASAYNIQFLGPQPVFADHLSIRKYSPGEFWTGHKQFCEQFLNPLLLRSYFGIPHNSWYRGNLEGVPTAEFARMLPTSAKLSWRLLSNVILPAYFQRGRTSDKPATFSLEGRQLPLIAFQRMLRQLHKWIAALTPADPASRVWSNYAGTTTYSQEEAALKRTFVEDFVRRTGVKSIIDLGCNTGDYSEAALSSGAQIAIGCDFDQHSLDAAFERAKTRKLNFLPLYLDARNPSPSQGWMEREREGFARRLVADGLMALAFEHHLAIAHNIPLNQVVEWLVQMAPRGVIEFIPKQDPTIQKMLALREDIFTGYSEAAFIDAIKRNASIVRSEKISSSGRTLFEYAVEGRPQ